jgi:hypothetical protein
MSASWEFQVRVYLEGDWAALARSDPGNSALKPLGDILGDYGATLKCQYDSFAEYLAEAEAEGADQFPLYKWTKATLADPEKCAKHLKAFALQVDGKPVYPKDVADALEARLLPFVDGHRITRVSKQDTNPANNLPVPKEFR